MSRARTILEVVVHTANGDIPALTQLLTTSSIVKLEHVLRILLTYLPEGTDPDTYTGFLQQLYERYDQKEAPATHIGSPRDSKEDEARLKVRRLRLLPLAPPQIHFDQNADPLSIFLIHQAHKIDADTGSLDLVCRLLEPFVSHSEILRTWMISTLLPLLRLNYEYHPNSGSNLSIVEFEDLEGRIAVQTLLSQAAQKHGQDKVEAGRDLRGLIGPWMYGESSRKRRKLFHEDKREALVTFSAPARGVPGEAEKSDWSYVNDWIVDLALRDFPQAVDAVVQWQGPGDVDYGEWGEEVIPVDTGRLSVERTQYAGAGLAAVYATHQASLETIIGSHRILQQVIALTELDEPPDLKRSDTVIESGIPSGFLDKITEAQLLHNNLLLNHNSITQPSATAVGLLNIVLASTYKLLNLGSIKSCKDVLVAIVSGTEENHKGELRTVLCKLKSEKLDDNGWGSVRRQILWLRNWEASKEPSRQPRGVFSKLPLIDIENELLRAMLDAGCYTVPVTVYCKKDSPLPTDVVKETILSAALSAYDAASNGNRTRGGVRKASDIISTFRSHYPNSQRFAQVDSLLSATHAMSFYSLTLQHGVPFQPVNIRAHKDPMSLIGKILDQNSHSYTHLEDLLEIGRNLVSAGLGSSSHDPTQDGQNNVDLEHERTLARRRVTRMAIEAALAEDDFDTAYSYVVNRLSISDSRGTQSDQKASPVRHDDISWRAAYAAGRYPANTSGVSSLRRLEQRMELLSQALLLAPPSALSELLVVWQQCEKQMMEFAAQESMEEKQSYERRERIIPGGFAGDSSPPIQKPRDPTRSAMQEEAPMGLFDVARGAAAALSKNAFPLRGNQKSQAANKNIRDRPLSMASMGDLSDDSNEPAEGQGRVRKRDMVSNMVTGGLASGIGWVIGRSSQFHGSM